MIMKTRLTSILSVRAVAAAAGLVISAAAMAADGRAPLQNDEVANDTTRLLAAYPGLHSQSYQGRIRAFYGMPMTTGATAEEAAQNFLNLHKGAFEVENLELEIASVDDVDFGRFKAFVYNQTVNGVPVEFGVLRLLVLNSRPDSDQPAVVLATGKLAPNTTFAPDSVSAEQAKAFVKGIKEYRSLQQFSQPELVVYFGEGDLDQWTTPTRCWKFVGETPILGGDGSTRRKITFFVDAGGTGLKHARNDVLHVDVNGTVQGWGTPGSTADHAGNPPVLMNLSSVQVGITGGSTAFANPAGNFVLSNPGTAPVTVNGDFSVTLGGRWVYINNTNGTGPALTASATVTPPGPANLVFNPAPSEFLTAQVNVIHHTNLSHDFIKDRAPTFTALDARMVANINLTSTCNAFYDGTINFYRLGGGCNNTAFSSVVAHEYGHHIVNRRSLAQGAFGEGFGDCISMMIYNDPVIGRFFRTDGSPVRTPDTANVPYPCTGSQAVHNCGQTLSGVWWEIKKAYDIKYGTTAGFSNVRQMFVNWYLVTAGGGGNLVSAYPTTAIEVLTVNDTDGNLNNGTPDYNEICNSFAQHAIACPAVDLLAFSYPNGRPSLVGPGVSGSIRVDVSGVNGGTPQPNTGTVTYRVDGGSWSTVAMTQGAANQYTASIPSQSCEAVVDYYVSASDASSFSQSDPGNAPSSFYSYTVASSLNTVADDAFETATGWTIGWPGDTATTGIWARGNPIGTVAQPEDDHTAGSGVNCFFTGQGTIGGAVGEADVDGGFTSLVSPAYNLAGAGAATLSYWRWYSNTAGSAPGADTFRIYVSNDNGTNWSLFETVGPTTQNSGGWLFKSGRVDSILPLTAQMRVKFVADDAATGSIIEAAIDDFKLESLSCAASCPADFNADTVVDFFDYLDFVAAFSSNDPNSDFNADTTIDFFDYLDFVAAFSTGCP
jgi:hypothetical protein